METLKGYLVIHDLNDNAFLLPLNLLQFYLDYSSKCWRLGPWLLRNSGALVGGVHGRKLGHWDLHSWMGNKYMVFFSQLNTSTWWACYHILKSSTTLWLGLKPSILWPKIKITLLWVDCYFFTVLKSWLVHVEVVSERRTSPSMVGSQAAKVWGMPGEMHPIPGSL